MIPRPDDLKRADDAQRTRIATLALVYACSLAAGWFAAAAFTLIQNGPGVAPW